MLLTENYRPPVSFHQRPQHQQQLQQTQNLLQPRPQSNYHLPEAYGFATNEDGIDLGADPRTHSISSSPSSTRSLLSQFSGIPAPLAGYDSIPTIAVPRDAHQLALFDLSPDAPLFGDADMMQHGDSWVQGQMASRSAAGPFSHQRESSLSSLGSAGPASPYSHTTSNPHIVADTMGDHFNGLAGSDDLSNYQLASPSKGFQTQSHGGDASFYSNYPNYASAGSQQFSNGAMSSTNAGHRNDRSLLPPPDFPHSNRSRPVSVASSVTSDSPLTPSGEPDEAERRRKNAFAAVPKLDRTMTDIYSDELFNPNFTITSAPPNQMPMSPNNEVFAQRLQAANSQHLSAVHSPVSVPSRDRSPFQHGSPLAPAPNHDFSSPHVVFNTAQQLREQRKAQQDAQAVEQQLARSASIGTPQTISPKDALLEYHPPDGEAEQPLFPQQSSTPFVANHLRGMSQAQPSLQSLGLDAAQFANFAPANMPVNMPISRPYPWSPQRSQHNGGTPASNGNSSAADSRVSPAGSTPSDSSVFDKRVERPSATGAESGTYTCTYHGCTMRFETPALLQKHKREGHRQHPHGLGAPRRPDSAGEGMTSTLLNSQAGPHKCDRINPTTGKPCNAVFSRPYDLTRHEDTIHNARKRKVRCNLCTDEKTFSRADALTRHYRVVHPDVEVPGKHRKRTGH